MIFSKARAKAESCEHLDIQRGPKALVIAFDWAGKTRAALSLIFAIASVCFYLPFFGMIVFASGRVWLWNEFSPYLMFVSAVVGFSALVFAYVTLAFWLNRTIVVVNSERLAIRHNPLPWPDPEVIPASSVEQLRIVAYESYAYGGDPEITGDETQVHALCIKATLKSKREVLLVNGLFDYVQAVQIEREIESLLGIVDHDRHDSIEQFKYSIRN